MTTTTNEAAFEAHIEQELVSLHGYHRGKPADLDKTTGINTAELLAFLEVTQKKELGKLFKDYRKRVPEVLAKRIADYGTIDVLKNDLRVDNIRLTLFYPKPAASDSQAAHENYARNRWTVTRQQTYSTTQPGQEIDMVLFVNGLPLATLELKQPWTGQTARVDGTGQYKTDRNPRETLLKFGRCLVHMAVDQDEVWMTTRLDGQKTVFMPFNQGLPDGQGAGNPPCADGYKTSYLWRRIFAPDTLADIISNYALLDFGRIKSGGAPVDKRLSQARGLIFPRYHQIDAVTRLTLDAAQKGVGGRYLVQHSAGSGKSNTITWLAFKLCTLCPASDNANRSRGTESHLFDSVIVVTDRRALDSQIHGYISSFAKSRETFAHADKASELKDYIEQGKQIIITTIEKFPYMCDTIGNMSAKNFAILIDEAHSSQSGFSAQALNKAMGLAEDAVDDDEGDEETLDIDKLIVRLVRNAKISENASFFAFTATPKAETLERFGVKHPDGIFHPFHLYSMKQAIEEGFILDVTRRYVAYKGYCRLVKKTVDNPEYDNARAMRLLVREMQQNPEVVEKNARVMLKHFHEQVYGKRLLGGRARAMVVTHNIRCAIEYHRQLTKLCEEWHLKYRPIIAFSGTKEVDGEELSEEKINGFPDTKTADYFDQNDAYRLLVVANKYITGFDQPKLCAMYVDKKLRDVQAVQTLSRLNRCASNLGKTADTLAVIDFCNEQDDMARAFSKFYTTMYLDHETDPNVLHELRSIILASGIVTEEEIEAFAKLYYNDAKAHGIAPIVDRAAARFNTEFGFDDETKGDLKMKAKRFVKIYLRLMSILPYELAEWDKLCRFLGLLIPKMQVRNPDDDDLQDLLGQVDMAVFEPIEVRDKEIALDAGEAKVGPTGQGVGGKGGEEPKSPLDEIIKRFNERFSKEWPATAEEQHAKFNAIAKAVSESKAYKERVEGYDGSEARTKFGELVKQGVIDNREIEHKLFQSYMGDKEFAAEFNNVIRAIISYNGGRSRVGA